MISRRALLGTLVGLPLGIKAAQATEIGEVKVTDVFVVNQQKIKDVVDVICNKFFDHFIYMGYPRRKDTGAGNSARFTLDLIPPQYLKMELGQLINWLGFFRFAGASDCLVKAGVETICTVMVEARKYKDNILISCSVSSARELPPVDVDTIYRATMEYDKWSMMEYDG